MKNKWVKTSKRMMLLYGMLVGLIFLFSPPRLTGKLQLAYAHTFSGLLTTGRQLTLASRTNLPPEPRSPGDYVRALETHRRLQQQIAAKEARIRKLQNHLANREAQLTEAHRRIDELAQLRTVPEWQRMRFQPAGVISNPGQDQTELMIDRGREDGLAVGQYVLGDLSVIGVVSDVMDQTARVKLITDPASKVPVRIEEMDAHGLMLGRGAGAAEIPGVADQEMKRQPKAGDRVYAVRVPGFPSVPIIAGQVVSARPDADSPLLWNVTIRPVCDIPNLTTVAVIISGR